MKLFLANYVSQIQAISSVETKVRLSSTEHKVSLGAIRSLYG
jgi:hypothetical protein